MIAAGVEQKLVEDALFLRNFLAHGCIFGDYIGMTETSFRKIELLDCIDVFKRLVETLRKTDPDVAKMLQQDIEMRLTEQLVDAKYKALSKVWFMATEGERFDWAAYGKTMQRIGHSYVTEKVEDALAWFAGDVSMNRYCIHRFHSAQKMSLSGIGEECTFDTLTIAEYMDNSIVAQIVGAELKKPFKKSGNHLIRYYEYK